MDVLSCKLDELSRAVSLAGRYFASGSHSGSVQLWARSGVLLVQEVHRLRAKVNMVRATGRPLRLERIIRFSDDGRELRRSQEFWIELVVCAPDRLVLELADAILSHVQ